MVTFAHSVKLFVKVDSSIHPGLVNFCGDRSRYFRAVKFDLIFPLQKSVFKDSFSIRLRPSSILRRCGYRNKAGLRLRVKKIIQVVPVAEN